jgi:hypothetical protein
VSLFRDPSAGHAPRARTLAPNQRPKRRARAARREQYWNSQIAAAPDGFAALAIVYDWIRAELYRVEEERPGADAEQIARHLATQLAQFATSIRKSKSSSAA